MIRIGKTDPVETHERMAELEAQAAAAFAGEISTEADPKRRQYLAKKARRSKQAAQFHRETAARLRGNEHS